MLGVTAFLERSSTSSRHTTHIRLYPRQLQALIHCPEEDTLILNIYVGVEVDQLLICPVHPEKKCEPSPKQFIREICLHLSQQVGRCCTVLANGPQTGGSYCLWMTNFCQGVTVAPQFS